MVNLIDRPGFRLSLHRTHTDGSMPSLDERLDVVPAKEPPSPSHYTTILDSVADYCLDRCIEYQSRPTIEELNQLVRIYTPVGSQQRVLFDFAQHFSDYFQELENQISASARKHLREMFAPAILFTAACGALSGGLLGYTTKHPIAGAVLGAVVIMAYRASLYNGSYRSDKRRLDQEFHKQLSDLVDSAITRLEATN